MRVTILLSAAGATFQKSFKHVRDWKPSMWLLTVALAVLAVFALEALAGRLAPRAWPWFRWSVLPPLGVLVAVGLPIAWYTQVPWLSGWLVVASGAMAGVLAATWGSFRHLLRRRPDLWELNATGMRSALVAPSQRR